MPAPRGPLAQEENRPRGELDRRLENRPELTPEEIEAMRANYAGNVSLIDDQIGRILETVEQRGEMDRTVVLFTSDHGEMNGDCGLIYKEVFLDGAVRVPLLVRTPETATGGSAGQVCESPVEWFDIGPTLVELAGGRVEYPQFARSLRPLLDDPGRAHRSEALSELRGEIMLLDREWKVALNAEGEVYLLFDLRNDPEERKNLAGRPGMEEVETRLRLRILERLVQTQLRGTAYRFEVHGRGGSR